MFEVKTLDEFNVDRVVSAPAMADDGSFAMTTFFKEVAGGGDLETWWKHCCDCGEPCGTMCIYCQTPAFECSCVDPWCEVSCDWSK